MVCVQNFRLWTILDLIIQSNPYQGSPSTFQQMWQSSFSISMIKVSMSGVAWFLLQSVASHLLILKLHLPLAACESGVSSGGYYVQACVRLQVEQPNPQSQSQGRRLQGISRRELKQGNLNSICHHSRTLVMINLCCPCIFGDS